MEYSNKYLDFVKALISGKICIFETDTVVGIACTVFSPIKNKNINININKIFEIKNRSKNKKLPWLISSKDMLYQYLNNKDELNKVDIDNLWPGSNSLILSTNNNVPKILSVNTETSSSIAFRIPAVKELCNAIKTINCPLACTSANISSENAVHYISEVNNSLLEKVDFVYTKTLYKGKNKKASTIIDCTGSSIKILR